MKRILAIDFGQRRCGIAVTDPLQIVANGLATVDSSQLVSFLKDYTSREPVELIVMGYPTDMKGNESDSMRHIRPAIGRIKKELPDIPIELFDERFTSVLAHRSMLDAGMRRSQRHEKPAIDRVSAAIILNDYLTFRRS